MDLRWAMLITDNTEVADLAGESPTVCICSSNTSEDDMRSTCDDLGGSMHTTEVVGLVNQRVHTPDMDDATSHLVSRLWFTSESARLTKTEDLSKKASASHTLVFRLGRSSNRQRVEEHKRTSIQSSLVAWQSCWYLPKSRWLLPA